MATMKSVLLSAAAVVALSLAAAPAEAADVYVVGADAPGGNCFPFGCVGHYGNRYQQVYSSSAFAGPLSISGLTFYNTNQPGGTLNSGTYTISLSTTSANVDALSTDFSANIGADNTTLFSGTLPTLTGSSFTLPFTGAFNYDPAQGNLLVDMVIVGIWHYGGEAFLNAYSGDAGGLFSRMHNFGSGYEGFGLETGFNVSAVPLPAALPMFGAAMAGLTGFGFLKRRKAA